MSEIAEGERDHTNIVQHKQFWSRATLWGNEEKTGKNKMLPTMLILFGDYFYFNHYMAFLALWSELNSSR